MPVSKILDLLRREAIEAMITLATRPLPILPLAVRDATERQNHDDALADEVDGMAGMVLWSVLGDVRPVH